MFAVLLAASVLVPARPADAQDPSLNASSGSSKSTAFPKQQGGMFGNTRAVDKALPLYLQGDQLIYDTKRNQVVAKGNVEIYYNDNILTADEVIYDQGASTLTAVGNVELKEANGNVVRAERYTLTDDFRDGFVQSLSIVTRDDSRITAEQAQRRGGNVTEFTNGRFTACKSEGNMPPLWCIGAKKVIHDQADATITYQDAWFEILGTPVFYLPYFQHPDPSVKRKSGFLMPSYGSSEDLGFMSEVPYYFALAPNFDFLFHPAYWSNQGVLWQGDWRHKLAEGEYSVKFAAIDQDCSDLPDGCLGNEGLDGWRGSFETKGSFSLSSWWKYGWDATIESDDEFRRFYKLDNILLTDRVNTVYLKGLSDRSYLGANLYHFGGLLAQDTPESESLVHPVIDHNYVFNDPVLGGELRWNTNVLSFSRSDVDVATGTRQDQDMNRAVTEITWRRRLTDTLGITYTPFAELRGDVYQLNDYVDPVSGDPISDETITRGLATGGATVAYPWVANGAGGSHVIEPIGQIVVRQASVEQRGLPDEDAKSLVFDDTTLFETDKFSGYDRLETGTRANVGIQYTFQANSGGYARVLAGESFHLKGDNPYNDPGADSEGDFIFSPVSGLDTDRSDYVLGLYLAPTDVFRVVAQSRFDDSTLDLRREDISAFFQYGPVQAQTTYAYAAATPELGTDVDQQDIVGALGLKLTDRWTFAAAARYDIDEEKMLTDSFSLRYLDECFMLSATYSETFITDEDRHIEPDRTVMLRFELKHLGGYKYKTDVNDFVFGDDQPQTP
ncbi:MAG TPA: LPS assembly protein LptD [Hyphomicrobiaceae bacterium]|nr:LPS assembly protein LptD [Hyphomicrobiaceae bacterium]